MFICASCQRGYDASTQCVICPHQPLLPVDVPKGGWKIHTELKEAIEEAYTLKEKDLLQRYMCNPNPLARAYAHRMYDSIKRDEAAEPRPQSTVGQ